MKIVVTVCDAAQAVHVGGKVENRSDVIEIPDDALPKIVKDYLFFKEWEKGGPDRCAYQTLTFSILEAKP
jgi:hypothetical protein